VTVLFSDIRSFTTFSEGKDPQQVVTQLNEYFDKMVGCIMENGGTVDKFIGDAIMAVFGGLLDLENPCESAVRAAEQMRFELALLNQKWVNEGLPTLENGIGLHYGEVLEGTIGSKDRKQFTVMGDTVNTAARLEGTTKRRDSKVIISASVFDRLTAELKKLFKSLGSTKVKGKTKAIAIYGLDAA